LAHNGKARLATFTPSILFRASQGGEYANAAARQGMLAGAVSNRLPLWQPTAYALKLLIQAKRSQAYTSVDQEANSGNFPVVRSMPSALRLYFRQNRKFDE
jgi:hypothetical protein